MRTLDDAKNTAVSVQLTKNQSARVEPNAKRISLISREKAKPESFVRNMPRPAAASGYAFTEIKIDGGDSRAVGINDAGEVVGRYWNGIDFMANYRAFIFRNGRMHDLNKLVALPEGYVLRQARGINNAGQIAAWGTDGAGREFGCLLTPDAGTSAARNALPAGKNRKFGHR